MIAARRYLGVGLLGVVATVIWLCALAVSASASAAATTTPVDSAPYCYDRGALSAQNAPTSFARTVDRMGASSPTDGAPQSVRAGLSSFVAAKSGGARFVVDSAGETRIFVRARDGSIEVSEHAARRIAQRGLTVDTVETVVNESRPFRYYHAGVWKTGYYDSRSRVFVGSAKGTITTVINAASPNYIRNLRVARP